MSTGSWFSLFCLYIAEINVHFLTRFRIAGRKKSCTAAVIATLPVEMARTEGTVSLSFLIHTKLYNMFFISLF